MTAGKGKPTDRHKGKARAQTWQSMAGLPIYMMQACPQIDGKACPQTSHKGAGKGAERRARARAQIALPGRARAQRRQG